MGVRLREVVNLGMSILQLKRSNGQVGVTLTSYVWYLLTNVGTNKCLRPIKNDEIYLFSYFKKLKGQGDGNPPNWSYILLGIMLGKPSSGLPFTQ